VINLAEKIKKSRGRKKGFDPQLGDTKKGQAKRSQVEYRDNGQLLGREKRRWETYNTSE